MQSILFSLGTALLGTPLALATQFTWDSISGAPLDDGAGTWAATGGSNWYDYTALTYGAWGNLNTDEAIFGVGNGAAGTIMVSGTVTANKLTFNTAGSGIYALSGGTITLGGTTPTITTNADASIASVLTGGSLTKTGSGTLTLTGNNTYTGNTTVDDGQLVFSNFTPLSSAGTTIANNASVTFLNNSNAAEDVSAAYLV